MGVQRTLYGLLTTGVVVAGLVVLPTRGTEATTLRNGPIGFARVDPALGDFSLWTAHPDGSHQRRLTTVPSFFSDWAPDGSQVAYDFLAGASEHIATIGVDGTRRHQLTTSTGIQEVPRYSPDGRLIAYDASPVLPDDPAFSTSIWVMSSRGRHPRQVTNDGFDVEPVFSPDGREIAFGRIVEPTSPTASTQREALYVVNTDGTGLRQVVAARGGLEHPDWSPDGKQLVFNIAPEANGTNGSGSIFAVSAHGGRVQLFRAAGGGWTYFKPKWAPDGHRLLVGCHRAVAKTDNICVITPGGGAAHVVVSGTPSAPVNFPSWGPVPR